MSEIGKSLKEAREKRNLTLDQISEKLRVKADYLLDIEERDDLPRDVFTIGYIRLYANYLRVNIDSKLKAFKNGEEEVEEEDTNAALVEDGVKFVKDQLIAKIKDPKYIKIASASVLTVLVVVGLFIAFNKNSDDEVVEMTPVAAEEFVPKNVEPETSITKINNEEFLVQNLEEENNRVFVVANDSTVVTFADDDGKVINEVFVRIGEKKELPKGHKNIRVKTRIASAIDLTKESN